MHQIRKLMIKASEVSARRLMLAENLIKHCGEKNHLIILSSSDLQYKTRHIPRTYHQDPNFYYYTGFMQKRAVLLMSIMKGNISSFLYIHQPSTEEILWNGSYPCKEEAIAITGVDNVGFYNEWVDQVDQIIKDKRDSIIWTTGNENCPNFQTNWISDAKDIQQRDISPLIDRQRVIKSQSELAILRESARITSRALQNTISYSRVSINEHTLMGKLSHEMSIDCAKLAYPPVIAGGNRANIIHYLHGDRDIDDGELVLVDVGADVLGYYSDMTRTWPIGGRFSSAQALLYDVLCRVHEDCVSRCTAESSLDGLLGFMYERLALYLVEEGVIDNGKHVHRICPHHIGHYLGLDIHDTPTISTRIPLAPGTVFPLEPGIYFPHDCDFVDPIFRGIGMRLEDDFVMTDAGVAECLAPDLPRSRSDIERLCNSL